MKLWITLSLALLAVSEVLGGIHQRIVLGENANPGDLPYQALMRSTVGNWCGATVINDRWVVTAAHCVEQGKTYYVMLGSVIFDQGTRYDIEKLIIHENYNADTIENDIALFKTWATIGFSDLIRPANLPSSPLPPGSTLTPSGWGSTGAGGGYPQNLQKTQVQSLSDAECRDRGIGLGPGMMCTLAFNGGGICFGDSGGPLVSPSNVIEGINSFVISGNCDTGLPNGFTKVFYYVDWIRNVMNNN